MADASLALAERRPDDLKQAVERLGQAPPSGRQLLLLRLMGLLAPPPSAGRGARLRGFAILIAIVVLLLAIGFGLAKLVGLAFGGISTLGAIFLGIVLIALILGGLALFGRRRQQKALAARRGG